MTSRGPSSARPNTPPGSRAVITIGTFDGVHTGHRALVHRARQRAGAIGAGVAVTALVFDPNPIEILRPAQAPPRLTTFEQKRDLLLAAGADTVHRLEPTSTLLHEAPEEFLAIVQRVHGMVGVVEGPDFRFGKARAGDIRTLARLGADMGFSCDVVEPVTVALNDHTVAPARSTMVRWLLTHGRVADAARVLGRPHTLRGRVVPGDRRGRTIGFPTANIETPCMAPADGVYAGWARLEDGRAFPAAVSIGTKPTFGQHQRAIEAVFLNPEGSSGSVLGIGLGENGTTGWQCLPDLPEYGWSFDLDLVGWIREQLRFGSLDTLLSQMHRDCARVLELIRLRPAGGSELSTLAATPSLETAR